ncbi:putative membrane protein [Bartonella schoenbuchensis]|uniref:Membrane protein n=1 Tax=Bartonella schoenbuchensis m07a TaxID=1094496 RepID=N6UGQ5_9HYPH|nr:putative membrane protein [Bartonella schoenbuchensis m07a]
MKMLLYWVVASIFGSKNYNEISSNLVRDILKHNEHGKYLCGGGKIRKRSNKDKELTETKQQLLHEVIATYQGVKMMSHFSSE